MGAFIGCVIIAFVLFLVVASGVEPYLQRIARAQEKLAGITHPKSD